MRDRRLRHQRKRDVIYDTHHVIPQSVCRRLGIDPNFEGNTKRIRQDKHRAWHKIFGNATPTQAIQIILDEWSLPTELKEEFKHYEEG